MTSAGEPTQLADGVAINPVWAPDGSVIVYCGPFAKGRVSLFGVRPDRTPVELPPARGPAGRLSLPAQRNGLVCLPLSHWTSGCSISPR